MNAAHVGQKVCHPVVIIKVNGVICCALLDPGVTGSYISAFLLNLLKVKPPRTLTRGFKTIMGLVIKHVETYMYNVKMYDTQDKCVLPVCRSLGLPLHPNKCTGPSTCLVVLGIELDTLNWLYKSWSNPDRPFSGVTDANLSPWLAISTKLPK